MDVLVIGNGGREHALIWKLRQSRNIDKIYCTIGNAGINKISEPIPIKPDKTNLLLEFAKNKNIGLSVVGPEIPLSLGIVDEFTKNGLKIFGPSKKAALLETSKAFAKDFMKRYNIPTAKYSLFHINQKDNALKYLSEQKYPVVIKADGLAAGKGVIICENFESAKKTVSEIFDLKVFGDSGEKIIVEEFLTGQEASVFAICDGTNYIVLPPAQDHKKIFDGEKGKNTGGMGSFAPADNIVDNLVIDKVKKRIIEPVLKYMNEEGNDYKGCLYCGLMIDDNRDPYVIEFNVRFGDPETQVVLPLITSDLPKMLMCAADGSINNYKMETNNEYYCSVVLASNGYPDKYETGKVITGLENVEDRCIVFHAGTTTNSNGEVITSGGRVLNVVGKSSIGLKEAIDMAYRNVNVINFQNKYYRTDIGLKGLYKSLCHSRESGNPEYF